MPIETHLPYGSTSATTDPIAFAEVDQSNKFDSEIARQSVVGRSSLPASSEATSVRELNRVRDRDHYTYTFRYDSDVQKVKTLYDSAILVLSFYIPQSDATIDGRRRRQFAIWLQTSFENTPLEDGMDHPAEQFLATMLQSTDERLALKWLMEFSLDSSRPGFASSVLRCLGRLVPPSTGLWRSELINEALKVDDIEIRDAAVQTVELWEDRDLISVLKAHDESQPWLRDYIHDLIEDLQE